MSIEVQSAPKISQIGLDRSDNDLQFCLDESGAITTKTTHSKLENISKHKEPISKDKLQDMASNYSDYYDSYDDDFEEDASPERSPRKRQEPQRDRERRGSYLSRDYTRSDISVTPPRRSKRQNDSRKNSLVSYRSAYGQSRATNKSSKKKTKKSQSASTRTVKTEDTSNMVQRILSANRNKIMKLYNTVEELQSEVDNLRQENRTLKRLHVKQEKELKQIEKAEASLPQLLQRHSAELRTYRERLKKTKVDMTKKEKESHSNDLEITKLREKVQHYKSLDDDKKLEERAALTRKLEKVEKALSDKDKRIMELQKTITLSEKARQREIKEQQERHKKATEELKKVRENVAYLKEKLKEKEKLLDNTNLYYQSIQKRNKRSNPLALPPVQPEDLLSTKDSESTVSHSDDKTRKYVFITNGPSDRASVTSENEAIKSHPIKEKSVQNEAVAKLEDSELREVLEREERRRKEEENAGIRDDELRRKQEEEFERMKQIKKKQEEERKRLEEERKIQEDERKRQEEEQKRREDERRKEEMIRKKREEEERIRKEKEEQERLKFKEDEETRRKKDLLLARMRAIDAEQNPKPNGIVDIDLGSKSQETKPKKLPIFLQSSEKPKETAVAHGDSHDHEQTKNGFSTSAGSRHSQSSSYDFKETIQNLHHGLPAHPSDQHLRSVAAKGQKNGIGDDELVFGSYKPSVGKRETKPLDTFGSYNPSFGETKNTGLDFSKKPVRKISTPPKNDDLVFGSYQPTFGAAKGNDASIQKGGRRGQIDSGQTSNSIFGDDLFSNNKPKQNQATSLFSEDSFGKSNDKSYPWEKKVNVSKQSVDEGLLPRRQKIQQGLNKRHEQNVPAVRNVLNDTIDDDIEEVTL